MSFNQNRISDHQAQQDIGSSSLPCMIAVINEISSNPRVGLTRPIGDWLPWLQDQGYTTEGFDQFFLALLSDGGTDDDYDHAAAEDFVLLESSYHEASSKGSTTIEFLASLKLHYPYALRACRLGLANRVKDFSDLSSLAGGKLTGPAATWIKRHPVYSSELACIALASIWCIAEHKVTADAAKNNETAKQFLTQNTLDNTVNQEALPTARRIVATSEARGIDISRGVENFEQRPAEFLDYNADAIKELKSTLLTQDNIQKFVDIALQDELGTLTNDLERKLLKDVNDFSGYLEANKVSLIDAERRLSDKYNILADKLGNPGLVNVYLDERGMINLNQAVTDYPDLEKEFNLFNAAYNRLQYIKIDRHQILFKEYINSGSADSINQAGKILLGDAIDNNAIIDMRLSSRLGTIVESIEDHEVSFIEQVSRAAEFDAEQLISKESTNLTNRFAAFMAELNEEVNTFIDDKV